VPDHAAAPARRGGVAVESLQSALQRALAGRGLEGELRGWEAVERWPAMVGPRIAGHSRAISYREGTLIVEVDGSAWMHELSVLKRQLMRTLNRELVPNTVRELRFVVPRGGNLR
jgi:predicted nucleic acid-binding Zn ribbon protein